mgnify:CR=1 FL=1
MKTPKRYSIAKSSNPSFSRRDFIATYPSRLITAAGLLHLIPSWSWAQTAPTISQPLLVNVMLDGGPDFRHLFPPPYDGNPSSYGYAYWNYRASSHGLSASPSQWGDRWSSAYHSVTGQGTTFGILKKAGWLKSMWDQGHVAIIHNVFGSASRDHHLSKVVYETGDLDAGKNDVSRDGWGGRLAREMNGNIVSMTNSVQQFCFGPDVNNPNSHTLDRIISARDSRNLGLYSSPELLGNSKSQEPRAIMDRAISSYMSAKTISAGTAHKAFKMHEEKLRGFGQMIQRRLADHPLPSALSALYTSTSSNKLYNLDFAQQIRNLYDCLLCNDLLNMKVASMSFGGFDTHKSQLEGLENNFSDLFGTGKAMETLFQSLESSMPTALNEMVFAFGGEFGRQLASNGGGGTDHGKGMTMIVVGHRVRGGVYGSAFPTSELADSANGFLRSNSDILGKTSLKYVFGKLCNRMSTGSGAAIFPNLAAASVESTGLLDSLFSS